MSSRFRSAVQTALGALAVALLVLVLRLTWDARQFAQQAEVHVRAGAYVEACASFMDAARSYYPGNPYANLAFARLLQLADVPAETPGAATAELPRRALEAFRMAALATRSVYVPHAAELVVVNERLAAIYAKWEQETQGAYRQPVRGTALAARQAWHLEKLKTVPGPSWLWSGVGLLGLGVSLAAMALFITKALSPTLKLERGPALGAGLAFVVGFALFLLGLTQ
ncbi:MAG: hypothetical protein SF187_00305 [Deltaproteobacteria bacterium]|nr:hypothetical protein [Deltaproteobacteria bacterium]